MVFHDLAGWVMMPMALGMLFMEQQILSHLFISESQAPAVVTRHGIVSNTGRHAAQINKPSSRLQAVKAVPPPKR